MKEHQDIVRRGLIILITILVVALGAQRLTIRAGAQTGSGTIRVATTGTDLPTCGSAAAPCRTIQYAVNLATSGDTIKIAQGTYFGTGARVVWIYFDGASVGKNLSLIGGYAPPDWNTPSTDPTKTIVDGQNARPGIEIHSVPAISVGIQNLTIQNGLAITPVPCCGEYSGGGLQCRNDHSDYNSTNYVTLSLSKVTFKNNRVQGVGSSTASGGGMSLYIRCRANLQDVIFEANQVVAGNATDGTRGGIATGGGLLAVAKSDLTGNNLTFTNNVSRSGSGGSGQSANGWTPDALGGAASFHEAAATLTGVTATGNQVIAGAGTSYGGHACAGALFFEMNPGTVSITDAVLNNNSVTGGSTSTGQPGVGCGGALYSTDTNVSLNRITAINNSSIGGSGTSFAGHAGGGALYFTRVSTSYPSTVNATNLILADNVTQAGAGPDRWGGGGAIFSQNTALTLSHATIARNSVLGTMQGPAIVVLHYLGASSLAMSHSIVASHGNTGAAVIIQQPGDSGNFTSTLFYDNQGGNYGCQPGFPGCVITNSNPVPTGNPAFISPGAPNYNYRIGGSSAAKDKATGSLINNDIDKNARPYNFVSDVGAFEYGSIPPTPVPPVPVALPMILKGN